MIFGKLLPREGNFFELFNQHANHIVVAAHAFADLVKNYATLCSVKNSTKTWTTQSVRLTA
jgi:hypothetical protein